MTSVILITTRRSLAWNISELQRNTMEWIERQGRCDADWRNTNHCSPAEICSVQKLSSFPLKMQKSFSLQSSVRNQSERVEKRDRRRRRGSSARCHHRQEILETKRGLREIRFLVWCLKSHRKDETRNMTTSDSATKLSQVAFQISFLIAEEGAGTKLVRNIPPCALSTTVRTRSLYDTE